MSAMKSTIESIDECLNAPTTVSVPRSLLISAKDELRTYDVAYRVYKGAIEALEAKVEEQAAAYQKQLDDYRVQVDAARHAADDYQTRVDEERHALNAQSLILRLQRDNVQLKNRVGALAAKLAETELRCERQAATIKNLLGGA